ncbi:MAG TPA: HEAT repeat domain-containing protein [Polyangiaceae bacterium]|jgi:HEAT repeat protein
MIRSSRLLVFLFPLLALWPGEAHGLVWPDVAERVERDLGAADPTTRRSAARELAELGPGRGGPLALAALGDADDEVKLAAAEAAIRLRAVGATDAVVSWLNAPDARLRRKACEVARSLPGPRAVAPLGRTLGDPDPEVRAAAADALGHQVSAEAVPPLLGRLDDPAPPVRIQIVGALARLGDPRAVVPLVGKVQDSSPDVREAVARALGDLGDTRASPALVLVLRDQNNDVRRDALAALGRMRAADAVDAIAPFATDRAPALRLAGLGALGRIASPDAVRVLVQSLGTGDDAAGSLERTAVRDALVTAGRAAVGPLHAVLAGSPSTAVATSAAWVLGELKTTSEAPAIVTAMRRGAVPTAAALHALAGAGTTAEVPVVLEFVADPSPVVRDEALGAAMALLDPNHPDGRAVEPLAAALRDARPSARERARMAALLGRTGAPRAAPLLVELVHAHDPALRLAAIDALGILGGEGSTADASLLEVLGSPEATVRLHAAVALSESGGATARDALLSKLDGGDEVDRAALLTALGGVLARAPSEAAVQRLAGALDMAAGPERDGIVEALGRAPLASAVKALSAVAKRDEPADRRAAASLLAAHRGDAAALAAARALLEDAEPGVRAQAAWTLGTVGDASDVARLTALARSADVDAAPDAVAAIGRIAARMRAVDVAARTLCPFLADPRPYPRANALAGLALAGARCEGGGAPERVALSEDPSEDVRASAALLLSRAPSADDARALERCARSDPSGTVAARCRSHAPLPVRTHPALVYVVAEMSTQPHAGAPYAMLLADGLIHAGTTDRRGGVFDPVAPEGEVTLRRPSALAR